MTLQKRRALDLLTTEKGGTCLFLGEDCCYFNETGIVQSRVKELRDRIEHRRKELQDLYPPQNLFQQILPPCSLSWGHWYLSFYSSYLDHVSPISFKGFSKNRFGPSLEIGSRPFFFSRASPQTQKKETVSPKMILHSRPKTIAPIQQEVAREIRCPFPHFFMISGSGMKESFGPGKENNSLKGPLLNHLTLEKTKHNLSSILMLQAGCIHLGLITPCPETYHPLHPPRRPSAQLQVSSQQKNTQNIPPD